MADQDRIGQMLVHLEYLREGQDKTNAHLAVVNGRLGKAETEIAILNDRAAKGAVLSGAVGTFVGGVIIAAYQWWVGAK
jgi:hypothetical protein